MHSNQVHGNMDPCDTLRYVLCRGSVANMLVTSCEDSICRLWVETVLPDDGLVNMNNFDPLAAQNPRFRTHRHKHKFMQRLKHMRYDSNDRMAKKSDLIQPSASLALPQTLFSTQATAETTAWCRKVSWQDHEQVQHFTNAHVDLFRSRLP